jgi:hypothetical protein
MIRKQSALPVDDLNAPLGQNIPQTRRSLPVGRWWMIAAGISLVLVGATAGALLARYRISQPAFVAKPSQPSLPELRSSERTGSVPENPAGEPIGPESAPPATIRADKPKDPATQTITIIDGSSGKREQIVVPAKPLPSR